MPPDEVEAPASFDPRAFTLFEFAHVDDAALGAIAAAPKDKPIVVCAGAAEEEKLLCYAAGATHILEARNDHAIAAILSGGQIAVQVHAEAAPAWTPGRDLRALVVDDIAENRAILAAQLRAGCI